MVNCSFCKAQKAQFNEYGVPICTNCFNVGKQESNSNSPLSALHRDLLEATLLVEATSFEFKATISDIPSGLPHPDGSQRIQNTSRKLAAALRQRQRAHNNLNDYLNRGIVPKDLKRSG